MSSKTKIVVLRMKEIIYTAIFLGLGILLVLLLIIMFRPKKDAPVSSEVLYIPGIYTSTLTLGSQEINVEVSVDADRINAITMTPLTDSVETMYPLIAPSLSLLAEQICSAQSTADLSWPEESHYTSQVLVQAIQHALDKAAVR
ncbi:MAG: hypothetical protein LUD07_03380 [Clostridiales bacterium]|nr:hypothetical protein [Clostridiales bacterium]